MQIDPRWRPDEPSGGPAPPRPPARTAAEQLQARQGTIPYLGPHPPPSRQLGRILRVGLIFGALSALARAALYLQRASLDRRLASNATADVSSAIRGNQDALSLITTITLMLAGAALLGTVLWRRQRRPKEILDRYGETYVESPLNGLMPIWLRLILGGTVALFVVAVSNSNIPTGTTLLQLAHYRDWSAVTMFALAGLWALDYAVVVNADRSYEKRVQLSADVREHPETVPYVPPIKRLRRTPA